MYQLLKDQQHYAQFCEETDGQQLINDAIKYMEDPGDNYNKDVMDIIVIAVADAIEINLRIYQRADDGNVVMLTQEPRNPTSIVRDIHLVFSRDTVSGLTNHYDPLIKVDEPPVADFTTVQDMTDDDWTDYNASVPGIGYQSDDSSCSQNSQLLIGRGRSFPFDKLRKCPTERVDKIPHNINGNRIYEVNVTAANRLERIKDGRHFSMNVTKRNSVTYNKVGKCTGHDECTNPDCSKQITSGRRMTHQWNYVAGQKQCFSCGSIPVKHMCSAVKYEEYNEFTGVVTVYHIGEHTCVLKPNREANKGVMRDAIRAHPTFGPKQLQRTVITDSLKRHDFAQARSAAFQMQDTKQLKYLKRREKMSTLQDRNSLTVVWQFKEQIEEKFGNCYYIYEVNDEKQTNKPNYVFKSSKIAAQIMLEIDQKGGGFLANETVYFDGMHKRCHGYKTLTLWVFNFVLRKLQRLATMEARAEDTKSIKKFFKVLNRLLSHLKGVEYKFNPSQIMVDENGANYKAIKEIFGDGRAVGCQFHFKNNAKDKANLLKPESREEFMEIIEKICHVNTYKGYVKLCEDITRLADGNQQFIKWYNWWDL